MSDVISNVLASRYASPTICGIWSESGRIKLKRQFWIAVLKSQRELGLPIPAQVIEAYEGAVDKIDLNSIRQREAKLRHDVKARIEEFCALAGHEHIHKGMTSRDLTDNVEQFQILRSLEYLSAKYVALLHALSRRAQQWADLVVVGRTHHAAAQPTTMGKRLAMFGDEMLAAFHRLESLIASYPLRGLQGAVGTGLDQLTLFQGDAQKLETLQQKLIAHLGFKKQVNAVGQIYPRSLDFDVLSCLFQLGSGVANMARTLRLMAGAEMATEGFAEGQVGSSAMPHKMNTRSAERINGFQVILGGYVHMVGGLAGDQWFEGDVSCSVVRRVALPDGFYAFDGMLETALHVLNEMGVYQAVIQAELHRYMPFLASTTLMMEAVARGAGREQAHEVIKEHAVAVALAMRQQGLRQNDLAQRLGEDARLPLNRAEIEEILTRAQALTGMAQTQVSTFVERVNKLLTAYPEARNATKSPML